MTVWKKLIAHAEAKSNACAYLDVDFELCALHVGGAGLEGNGSSSPAVSSGARGGRECPVRR